MSELQPNSSFRFSIDGSQNFPKFRQIIDSVNNAIAQGSLNCGDALPSVNQVCSEYQLSRDTVFKAYSMLKEQGIIDSVPNKGYFVAEQLRKVFVFLDTFKAYKEVLYDSFVKNLPRNVIADVNFHHYNIQIFKKLIEESIGRYSKYVVMPFHDPKVADALALIPADKLLIIDWNLYRRDGNSVIYQDFGRTFYDGMAEVKHLFKKYQKVIFLYPEFTNHPTETVEYFTSFCIDNGLKHLVQTGSECLDVHAGEAYISVSDRMLGRILEQCRAKKLEPGVDVGIVSYNETPMKKFINKGITVFSTDFEKMGKAAAEFVTADKTVCVQVPSGMIIRESL